MAEAHVVKNVLIPFLSALTFMHTQVGLAFGEGFCLPLQIVAMRR
jgi:hypothetical protein